MRGIAHKSSGFRACRRTCLQSTVVASQLPSGMGKGLLQSSLQKCDSIRFCTRASAIFRLLAALDEMDLPVKHRNGRKGESTALVRHVVDASEEVPHSHRDAVAALHGFAGRDDGMLCRSVDRIDKPSGQQAYRLLAMPWPTRMAPGPQNNTEKEAQNPAAEACDARA